MGLIMTKFTIFHNIQSNKYVAVYDFQLPTQTGIGEKPEWVPVHSGMTSGLFDKLQQTKDYIKSVQLER